MKKEIEIAISRTQINKVTREIDLPDNTMYFSKNDDGNFFPRGLILFAIIPDTIGNYNSYTLIQVERNKQDSNDFVPSDDCKSEYWLNHSGIRKQAFEIITNPIYHDGFKEITAEEFNTKRIELLNEYQKH